VIAADGRRQLWREDGDVAKGLARLVDDVETVARAFARATPSLFSR
jgi:hypothetical protein